MDLWLIVLLLTVGACIIFVVGWIIWTVWNNLVEPYEREEDYHDKS